MNNSQKSPRCCPFHFFLLYFLSRAVIGQAVKELRVYLSGSRHREEPFHFISIKMSSSLAQKRARFSFSLSREYWMIYREPSILAVIWFGSSPTHSPSLTTASCLSFQVFLCVAGRIYRRGVGGGRVGGEDPSRTARQPGRSSINHSILSVSEDHRSPGEMSSRGRNFSLTKSGLISFLWGGFILIKLK